MRPRLAWLGVVLVLLTAACGSSTPPAAPSSAPSSAPGSSSSAPTVPRWKHVVVLVMGGRSYQEVLGSGGAPFISLLARSGTSFSNARALAAEAQPNYLALFAGSTFGITTNYCPHRLDDVNLAQQLDAAGYSFASYAQGLPRNGFRGCADGDYRAARNPVASFVDVPVGTNLTLGEFPEDFAQLPSVAFVLPDRAHSMDDSSVAAGDGWVRAELSRYATWTTANDSLLVITWDRSSDPATNHIPMVAIGAHLVPGVSTEPVGHYQLLATLQDAFGLKRWAGTTLVSGISALDG